MPLTILTPEMFTVPARMSKTRSAVMLPLPSMIVLAGLAPAIVTVPVMSRSPPPLGVKT